jgi:biopolymer transport protein ExbD
MAPLIDLIFILLIFFLVTASFVRETGLGVTRPQAVTAETRGGSALKVTVTEEGDVHIGGERVAMDRVRGLVEIYLTTSPYGEVMVEADQGSRTGRLIEVLDQCRLAGAKSIAVAARKAQP